MRILAIETTAFTGSLALLEGDRVVAEAALPEGLRSAQSLVPAIGSLMADHRWEMATLQLIAVVHGPGSFTGLRVGITTAKTLAYALQCETIGVDTLEVLAAQARPAAGHIYPIVDAQRGQLFTAAFTWPAGEPFPVRQSPTGIVDLSPWLAELHQEDLVVGPPVPKLAVQLLAGITPENRLECQPQASTAGRLAWRDYQAGRRDSLWTLAPQYHRASAPEEKRAAEEQRAAKLGGL